MHSYSQLQEGLNLELMKASSVSGAGTYQALCLAAKNEERRLAELRKQHLHKKSLSGHSQTTVAPSQSHKGGHGERRLLPKDRGSGKSSLRCYNCNEVSHLLKTVRNPAPRVRVDRKLTHLETQALLTLGRLQLPNQPRIRWISSYLEVMTKQ